MADFNDPYSTPQSKERARMLRLEAGIELPGYGRLPDATRRDDGQSPGSFASNPFNNGFFKSEAERNSAIANHWANSPYMRQQYESVYGQPMQSKSVDVYSNVPMPSALGLPPTMVQAKTGAEQDYSPSLFARRPSPISPASPYSGTVATNQQQADQIAAKYATPQSPFQESADRFAKRQPYTVPSPYNNTPLAFNGAKPAPMKPSNPVKEYSDEDMAAMFGFVDPTAALRGRDFPSLDAAKSYQLGAKANDQQQEQQPSEEVTRSGYVVNPYSASQFRSLLDAYGKVRNFMRQAAQF